MSTTHTFGNKPRPSDGSCALRLSTTLFPRAATASTRSGEEIRTVTTVHTSAHSGLFCTDSCPTCKAEARARNRQNTHMGKLMPGQSTWTAQGAQGAGHLPHPHPFSTVEGRCCRFGLNSSGGGGAGPTLRPVGCLQPPWPPPLDASSSNICSHCQ